MQELLRELLNRLAGIGDEHEELYDTECRDAMGNAVMNGFVRAMRDFVLPKDFGLYSTAANQAVRQALQEYITRATAEAAKLRLDGFHDRLAAFQNPNVKSDGARIFYDDFFGYAAPEAFDAAGNVISEE